VTHDATSTLPSDVSDVPAAAQRRDDVANAILGNGSLLATVSRYGELEQLWWPHLDDAPQLGEIRLGHAVGDEPVWFDRPAGGVDQRYEDATDLLVTDIVGVARITDVVDPDVPVLLRQITGAAGRLVVHARPHLAGTPRAGGAYVDPSSGALVFHRRDHVLAIAVDVPAAAKVADREAAGSTPKVLLGGGLAGGIVHGEVEGTLVAEQPSATVTVALAFADDRRTAVQRARQALDRGFAAIARARTEADAAVLAKVTAPLGAESAPLGHAPAPLRHEPAAPDDAAASRGGRINEVVALDRRSHLVFSCLTDRATGGVLAGPEVDAWFQRSGGYGFVWPRDLAFILLAYLASGRDDLARPALRWLVRSQGEDGLWLQRNWTDGRLAPSWGTQLDETGAVLVAFEQAWATLGDAGLDRELWPAMARGADALVETLDPATGLPAPSMDLWEERVGVHAFTAATACAGLRAAAAMAQRWEPARAQAWRDAAQRIRTGIDEHLWSPAHGRYLRSIDVARGDTDGAPTPVCYDILDHPSSPVASVDPVDEAVDVSLLGLVYPFGVFGADEPRMAATIAAVRTRLATRDGGLRRYEGDTYVGGNPWILARLWLGLTERTPGSPVPADGLDYAIRAATSTSLLPEQIDEVTGAPAWVVPLTWSHAMFVLACRPDPRGLPSTVLPSPRRT
jgi:glucoamylase